MYASKKSSLKESAAGAGNAMQLAGGHYLQDNRPLKRQGGFSAGKAAQLMSEADKPLFLAFVSEASKGSKVPMQYVGLIARSSIQKEISLDDAKLEFQQGLVYVRNLYVVYMELSRSAALPNPFNQSFANTFKGLIEARPALEEAKETLIQTCDRLRVEGHGGTEEEPGNLDEFKVNLSKFFIIPIPAAALNMVAANLIRTTSNADLLNLLKLIHSTTEKPRKSEYKTADLKKIIGERAQYIPEAIIKKVEDALDKNPALVIDDFRYAKLALKEEMTRIGAKINQDPPSRSACRLMATAIQRAIRVSSAQFMAHAKVTVVKESARAKAIPLLIHETVHAANEEAENQVSDAIGHIFAEVFTEISANIILGQAPTAYQLFIPRGREIINHIYGNNKNFLEAFFSGNVGKITALFSEPELDTLKRIDGDVAGLISFLQITDPVVGKLEEAKPQAQKKMDEMDKALFAQAAQRARPQGK